MKNEFKRAALLLLSLAFATSGQGFALDQYIPPRHVHRTVVHHRIVRARWTPAFKPSHESMVRQNEEVDRLELPRIQDDAQLEQLKAGGELVPIVAGDALRFDPRLDPSRRYCRPWTRDFVEDLSNAYYERFHAQIQVNSAVRTVKVQKKLRRHNRNAAAAEGDLASSHLAGITVDLQRRGMSRQQMKWVEDYMMPLKNMGMIEPEEERHQVVFHVMVSDRYSDWREARMLAGDKPEVQDELTELQR